MFDFERAKQKFDNISRSAVVSAGGPHNSKRSSGGPNGSKHHSSQSSSVSGIPKRQSSVPAGAGSGSNTNNSGIAPGSYYDSNNFPDNRCDDSIPLLSSSSMKQQVSSGGAAVINDSAGQFFDNDLPVKVGGGGGGGVGSKLNITKMNNINLDALKVSEDDTVSGVGGACLLACAFFIGVCL